MKNIIKLLVLLPLFATMACDDLFEPAIENNRDCLRQRHATTCSNLPLKTTGTWMPCIQTLIMP